MKDLIRLAELLRQRNSLDEQIATLIARPATTGHLGEYIAHKVFGIELMESASHKGIDGFFRNGSLVDRSVNVKFYPKNDGLLSISVDSLPDYFLIFAGPKIAAGPSRGQLRPHLIESVFIFEARVLVTELSARNIKIGIATSVRNSLWEQAEIYPLQHNKTLILDEELRMKLSLFGSRSGG